MSEAAHGDDGENTPSRHHHFRITGHTLKTVFRDKNGPPKLYRFGVRRSNVLGVAN